MEPSSDASNPQHDATAATTAASSTTSSAKHPRTKATAFLVRWQPKQGVDEPPRILGAFGTLLDARTCIEADRLRRGDVPYELQEAVENRLATLLTFREREVVKLRHGIGGDGHIYSVEHVGRIFRIPAAHVRQIATEAMQKLDGTFGFLRDALRIGEALEDGREAWRDGPAGHPADRGVYRVEDVELPDSTTYVVELLRQGEQRQRALVREALGMPFEPQPNPVHAAATVIERAMRDAVAADRVARAGGFRVNQTEVQP